MTGSLDLASTWQGQDPEVGLSRFAERARTMVGRLQGLEPLDPRLEAQLRSMTAALEDAVSELTASRVDPELSASLARPARQLARCVGDPEGLDAAPQRSRIALALLAVVQSLEADAEGRQLWARPGSDRITDWLLDELQVTHGVLAGWLEVTPRTISRWAGGEVAPSAGQQSRLRALARLVAQLRFVYPPRGVVQFLQRPMQRWGRRSLLQILDDEEALLSAEQLIRGIRG